MKHKLLVLTLALFAFARAGIASAQTDEIKLEAAQPKITTVSAMRARKAPQVATDEIMRLKLGTVVSAVARSANQDTIGGKTDYWYRVTLPDGVTGWLFGGVVLACDCA